MIKRKRKIKRKRGKKLLNRLRVSLNRHQQNLHLRDHRQSGRLEELKLNSQKLQSKFLKLVNKNKRSHLETAQQMIDRASHHLNGDEVVKVQTKNNHISQYLNSLFSKHQELQVLTPRYILLGGEKTMQSRKKS